MTTACRSCKMDYSLVGGRRHRLIDVGLQCPLCYYNGKWCSHINDDLWGDGIECRKCHNYILYVSPENQIWKDEIYLQGEVYLIRHIDTNTSALYIGNKTIVEMDHIIQFQDLAQLERRIKTMMVFS